MIDLHSTELITQLGPTAGVIVVVFAFIKHLNVRDEQLNKSFEENSVALKDNSDVLSRVLERLRDK